MSQEWKWARCLDIGLTEHDIRCVESLTETLALEMGDRWRSGSHACEPGAEPAQNRPSAGQLALNLYRVVEVQKDHVLVHDAVSAVRARVPHALQRQLMEQTDALAVGDWVLAQTSAVGECVVHYRLPPRNQLARRLHDGRDKVARVVMVSNVDFALLVMGLDHDFNLRRLERYLALTRMAGVPAVVVLTKADLMPGSTDQRLAEVRAALPADTPALALSGLDPQARTALGGWLRRGQTLVLLGSSGAGKSTLTNTLCAAPLQDTGATRAGDGRGRHTTTVRSLHRTPEGACIIDTPGLRTLRLDGDQQSLHQVYEDVATLAAACRFRNCQHEDEPGCAVRATVDPARLLNWHKLQREAQRDQMSALERQRQLSVWKQHSRIGRERARDKRS